jgi:hypothetical protein
MRSRTPGFVRFQQGLAREALRLQQLGAARAALRVLRSSDFTVPPAFSEHFLAILRSPRSSEEEVAAAVRGLIELDPAGP